MLTVWQQEELVSGTLFQTITHGNYGNLLDTYDSFGWHRSFHYDSFALAGSPSEINYLRVGASANSFIRNSRDYDKARRLIYKNNEMIKRLDYFTYDSNGLLKQSRYRNHLQGGWPYFTESGNLTFARDTSGLITGVTGDKEFNANYDQDLQISSINHILPQPFGEGYTYDDNGNRLSSLTNSFIYDNLNRLTESTTHNYTYDADGNLIEEKNKLTGESKKYYYDSENKMVKYEHQLSDASPIDITATYKYDIYGRRIQKNVNDNVTNFFWENDTMTYELNEQYQPIRKYITGFGMDDYEGHIEYSEVTDWYHIFLPNYGQPWYSYIKDQVGTIYKVHSLKTRSIAESRTYDSFGNLVNQTGTTQTPLGFQGKYYDQESGLNYFYHRYYNPAIGRFTTEDPIGLSGKDNFINFVDNNPINYSDPFGLKKDCPQKNCWNIFWKCCALKGISEIPFLEEMLNVYDIFDKTVLGESPNAENISDMVESGAGVAADRYAESAFSRSMKGKTLLGGMRHPNQSSIYRKLIKKASFLKKISLLLNFGMLLNDAIDCWNQKLDCEMANLY